jgi:quercetin dioxygenase-like cupin family protein
MVTHSARWWRSYTSTAPVEPPAPLRVANVVCREDAGLATTYARLNHKGVDYMTQIVPVDVTRFALDIHRDLSVSPRARKSGPPERIDGMTVGFVSVTRDAPHNGEVHPDGDEILYVLSGKLRVIGESDPSAALDLGPGEACIVRRGEWHRVIMLEPSQLLHITPGPRGGFRLL